MFHCRMGRGCSTTIWVNLLFDSNPNVMLLPEFLWHTCWVAAPTPNHTTKHKHKMRKEEKFLVYIHIYIQMKKSLWELQPGILTPLSLPRFSGSPTGYPRSPAPSVGEASHMLNSLSLCSPTLSLARAHTSCPSLPGRNNTEKKNWNKEWTHSRNGPQQYQSNNIFRIISCTAKNLKL